MLASTIIPALIPKKGKGVYNKNFFLNKEEINIQNYLIKKLSSI